MSSSTVDEVERGGGGGRSATTTAAGWMVVSWTVAWVLAGCAAPQRRAPVEDRTAIPAHAPVAVVVPPPLPASAASDPVPVKPPLPGSENAGKPGYYTVKPMDTLIRIGLDSGQSWRDLVKWNNLENPNIIEVGQVLRVYPPGADPTSAGSRPVATTRVETRALGTPAPASPIASAPLPVTPPPVVAAPAPAPTPRDGDDSVAWSWPTTAPVGAGFDDARNKGLAFYGKAGDPVYASADGRVMYAGAGLPGYGNLVILKHNSNYLTAYAHNQTLLVKEDQPVRKGQKIAEMGSTDAERVELHFEIRKQGKPVDPAKLLPAR